MRDVFWWHRGEFVWFRGSVPATINKHVHAQRAYDCHPIICICSYDFLVALLPLTRAAVRLETSTSPRYAPPGPFERSLPQDSLQLKQFLMTAKLARPQDRPGRHERVQVYGSRPVCGPGLVAINSRLSSHFGCMNSVVTIFLSNRTSIVQYRDTKRREKSVTRGAATTACPRS